MNIKLNYYNTGDIGIFSRLMRMISNAIPYDVDKINFTSDNGNENPYNWIFDQENDDSYTNIECKYFGSFVPKHTPSGLGKIEESENFDKLKLLISKIKIKKHILDWVKINSSNFGENCLSVHVRLGDMNLHHPQFGIATINDYVQKIKEVIDNNNIDKIFVASDNDESLEILQKHFPTQILFIPNMIRSKISNFSVSPIHINLNNPTYWEESLKECLLLSKGNQLLCRVSNLANASIIFSDSTTKIYRIHEHLW